MFQKWNGKDQTDTLDLGYGIGWQAMFKRTESFYKTIDWVKKEEEIARPFKYAISQNTRCNFHHVCRKQNI